MITTQDMLRHILGSSFESDPLEAQILNRVLGGKMGGPPQGQSIPLPGGGTAMGNIPAGRSPMEMVSEFKDPKLREIGLKAATAGALPQQLASKDIAISTFEDENGIWRQQAIHKPSGKLLWKRTQGERKPTEKTRVKMYKTTPDGGIYQQDVKPNQVAKMKDLGWVESRRIGSIDKVPVTTITSWGSTNTQYVLPNEATKMVANAKLLPQIGLKNIVLGTVTGVPKIKLPVDQILGKLSSLKMALSRMKATGALGEMVLAAIADADPALVANIRAQSNVKEAEEFVQIEINHLISQLPPELQKKYKGLGPQGVGKTLPGRAITIPKRLPGETIPEYLKRIGK